MTITRHSAGKIASDFAEDKPAVRNEGGNTMVAFRVWL